jgi:hypothetical protein
MGNLSYYTAFICNFDLNIFLFPFSVVLKNSSFLFVKVKKAVNSPSFRLTVQSVQRFFMCNQIEVPSEYDF